MRELLITLQKELMDLEFKAGVLVQEVGLALDKLDLETKKAENLAELARGLASVGLALR